VFLTEGRGLTAAAAGVVVSAYWAMMFFGRVILGSVAERLGAARVLGAAVVGVSVGSALMVLPGAGAAAVGLIVVGLAAAPVFPLFTLTTGGRLGADDAARTTWTVSLQVAASAVGGAAVPAGIGLAIGAFTATALAPPLLVLSLTMCVVYRRLTRSP
jgi:fucose permease